MFVPASAALFAGGSFFIVAAFLVARVLGFMWEGWMLRRNCGAGGRRRSDRPLFATNLAFCNREGFFQQILQQTAIVQQSRILLIRGVYPS